MRRLFISLIHIFTLSSSRNAGCGGSYDSGCPHDPQLCNVSHLQSSRSASFLCFAEGSCGSSRVFADRGRLEVDSVCDGEVLETSEGSLLSISSATVSINCQRRGTTQLRMGPRSLVKLSSGSRLAMRNGALVEAKEAVKFEITDESGVELVSGSRIILAEYSSLLVTAASRLLLGQVGSLRISGHWKLRTTQIQVSDGGFILHLVMNTFEVYFFSGELRCAEATYAVRPEVVAERLKVIVAGTGSHLYIESRRIHAKKENLIQVSHSQHHSAIWNSDSEI